MRKGCELHLSARGKDRGVSLPACRETSDRRRAGGRGIGADPSSRDKLLRLYAHGLKLTDKLTAEAVKRTEGVSAAFLKELTRRVAQSVVSRGECAKVGKEAAASEADLARALDDMLFSGGALNVKLLGGAYAEP